jgi:hypothetical protein
MHVRVIRLRLFACLLSKFLLLNLSPAVWFVTELHESKIGTMTSFILILMALSFKAPITKATSKGHPHWRALSGARRIVWVRKPNAVASQEIEVAPFSSNPKRKPYASNLLAADISGFEQYLETQSPNWGEAQTFILTTYLSA